MTRGIPRSRGLWICSSCNHAHPFRMSRTSAVFDRSCKSCSRRCRRTLNRSEPLTGGRGGKPTAAVWYRPDHMPMRAIRAECKARNRKQRAKRAARRALDHDQPLERWGPLSTFQRASERVRGMLRAETTPEHFFTGSRALSERDDRIIQLRGMVDEEE
jgi:hypothetical protein